MRVITFSRTFPAYHPRKGEQTHFVEQIWNSLRELNLSVPKNADLPNDFMWSILPLSNFGAKHHTIRAGNRWKAGDFFSPRVWSGKPYASKQITIAPPIEIKKIWIFCIWGAEFKIDETVYGGESESSFELLERIALNDGLNRHDLMDWLKYPKTFSGQIICWNENINY